MRSEGLGMTIQDIANLVETPLAATLFLHAAVLAMFLYLRGRDTEGFCTGFIVAIGVSALREVLFALLPDPSLLFVSDLVLYSLTLLVFLAPYGSWLTVILVLALNLLFAGFRIADTLLGLLPAAPAWAWRGFLLLDVAVLVAFAAIKSKDRDTVGRQAVQASWPWASAILLVYAILSMALDPVSPWFRNLVSPILLGAWGAFAFAATSIFERQIVQALDYYEESIDSLYNVFMSTASELKESFSMDRILDAMSRTITAETGADGSMIFLVDEFDDVIVARAYSGLFPPPFPLPDNLPRKQHRVESYMKHVQFKLGETLFGEIARTAKQVFIPAAAQDERVARNGDEDFLRLASLIALPLQVEDRVIGVLALSRSERPFSERDFDRAKLLANFGTLSITNFFAFMEAREKGEIERAADIAAEIQRAIVPRKLPDFAGASFGAFTIPAKGVSGDYYDVIQTRSDKVVIAVGDVAGKGVAAGLVMVMIRSILHLVTNTDRDISTVLTWVNRGITGKIDMDHYATVSLASVDLSTGEVDYANAGHQPMLVYRKSSDAIETLEIKSVPLGVERVTDYPQRRASLEDGDIVVLYTDGLVEAMNAQGKQYGRKNLGSIVMRNHELPAREIANRIQQDLANFVGAARQHDDQTVLVMKMKR